MGGHGEDQTKEEGARRWGQKMRREPIRGSQREGIVTHQDGRVYNREDRKQGTGQGRKGNGGVRGGCLTKKVCCSQESVAAHFRITLHVR